MYCQTSYNYSYDLRTSNLNPLCGLDRLLRLSDIHGHPASEGSRSDEQPNENASSESGEDVSNPEASTATEQSDIPVPAENPSSETVSQTQTAEPDNTDATSASDATDEDEIEDTTHADAEAAPSEAGTSTGSNFSPSYREPILTDGILVDDIFKAIDQLAETGECDLGTIIYHCESMRYAG